MRILAGRSFTLLLIPPALLAQEALPRTVDRNQMALVPAEVRLIEVESLPMDSAFSATNQPGGTNLSGDRGTGAVLTDGDTRAQARLGRSLGALSEDGHAKDNGMKMYLFTLAPGERIVARLHSEGADRITQRFGVTQGPGFSTILRLQQPDHPDESPEPSAATLWHRVQEP